MDLRGTCWIAVQDIGGFTPLSEDLAKKGKTGTERLTSILNGFFDQAETGITRHQGQLFKLAGDAFYAILPGTIGSREITGLGKALLGSPALIKNNLTSRFVAVRGKIEGEWVDLGAGNYDLVVKGPAVYDLSLLEEQTPAGTQRIIDSGQNETITKIPASPRHPRGMQYLPAHRPVYTVFLQIPQDFGTLSEMTEYIRDHWHGLKLLKWLPMAKNFNGLLISGFPDSTGKEAELVMNFYYDLKTRFPNLTFKMSMTSGMVFAGEMGGKKFREFAVIGDRVNVAARLQQIAPSQTLYFSGEISRLLRGKFSIKTIGATRLKGKTEPIEVCQPGEKVVDIFEDTLFPHHLVGRKRELKRMRHCIRRRKSCCAVGEAGLGKSRMLYEIRKGIESRHLIMIGMTPISPPLTFLRELSAHFPAGEFAELNDYLNGKIKLTPVQVQGLVRSMARTKPGLTIIVEDLHWIDDASFSLISGLKPLPFLLIASSRPEADRLIKILGLKIINLGSLNHAELNALTTEMLGAAPSPSLFKVLVDKSEGNPFYLEQIIYDLQERRCIRISDRRARLDAPTDSLPFGIHSIIMSRFARLPIPNQKTMEIAACIGREFEPSILKKIATKTIPHLKRGIKEGILTVSGGIYLFKHALFREAILSSMLDAIRRKYESAIGRVFIAERKPDYEIAVHLTAAGNISEAAPYWRVTLGGLLDRGLELEISDLLQKLDRDPNPRVRSMAILLNAYHLTRSSDYFDAETLFNQLLSNKDLRKQALFGLCGLFDWSTKYDRMGKVLPKLGAYAMQEIEKIEYYELRGIYCDMTGNNHQALAWYRRALAFARRHRLEMPMIASLHNIGWIHQKNHQYQKARRYFNQALLLVPEGWHYNEGTLLLRLGQIENEERNLGVARNHLLRSLKDFQRASFPYWEMIARSSLADNAVLAGDKATAYRYGRRADDYYRSTHNYTWVVPRLLLHYGKFKRFAAEIRGMETNLSWLYYIYLYAVGKPEAAEEFITKNHLARRTLSRQELAWNHLPTNPISLHKRYVRPPQGRR